MGVSVCVNNKNEEKKKISETDFYDASLKYERETIDVFNLILGESMDKIPKINTLKINYRDEVIDFHTILASGVLCDFDVVFDTVGEFERWLSVLKPSVQVITFTGPLLTVIQKHTP